MESRHTRSEANDSVFFDKIGQADNKVVLIGSSPKRWLSLKEAAALKGISYKTFSIRKVLQPNRGIQDGRIGGKKAFKAESILCWLELSDSDITGSEI